MNRRNFLLITLTSIIASVVGKVAACEKIYVTKGKLGYKIPGNKGRQCKNCKHFEAKNKDGICKLKVMQNVMKSPEVHVIPEATCNMWIQK